MLLAGDEMRRTQRGNNNAYCQDNDISWINWDLEQKNSGLVRFTKTLMSLRKNHKVFRGKEFSKGSYNQNCVPETTWYDSSAKNPTWDKTGRFLAFKLNGMDYDNDFYIASNMDLYDLTITLPALTSGKKWYRVADTSFNTPEDILENEKEELLAEQRRYVLIAGSSIILMSK